jgi:DNA-binding XRE family transcriptional regulator
MRKKGYYVYTLAYPTGEVFYVGKGIRGRINLHEAEARKGVNSHKCNIIRKIWREGGEVIKTKVYEGLSEEEAFEYERMLIAAYGRKNLVNLTDGGEGASGHIPSDETRAKIRDKANARQPLLGQESKKHTSIPNGEPKLKYYRLETGLSRSKLARYANLSEPTIERAEKGEPIVMSSAQAIAKAISKELRRNVNVQDLGIAIFS